MKNFKKLSVFKVYNIKASLAAGVGCKKLAKKYGVHHSTIEGIKNGLYHNPDRIRAAKESFNLKMRGENAPSAKLTGLKVKEIKKLLAQHYTCNELARRFEVSATVIYLIKYGKIWKHIF